MAVYSRDSACNIYDTTTCSSQVDCYAFPYTCYITYWPYMPHSISHIMTCNTLNVFADIMRIAYRCLYAGYMIAGDLPVLLLELGGARASRAVYTMMMCLLL